MQPAGRLPTLPRARARPRLRLSPSRHFAPQFPCKRHSPASSGDDQGWKKVFQVLWANYLWGWDNDWLEAVRVSRRSCGNYYVEKKRSASRTEQTSRKVKEGKGAALMCHQFAVLRILSELFVINVSCRECKCYTVQSSLPSDQCYTHAEWLNNWFVQAHTAHTKADDRCRGARSLIPQKGQTNGFW